MFRGEVCAKLRQYLFLTVSDKEFVKKTGPLLFRYWCIEIFVWPTWPIKTEFYDGGWSGKSCNSYKGCHSVITFCRLNVSDLLLFRWSLCLKSSQTRNQRRNSQHLLVSSCSCSFYPIPTIELHKYPIFYLDLLKTFTELNGRITGFRLQNEKSRNVFVVFLTVSNFARF